jgi:ribosome-binding factor A
MSRRTDRVGDLIRAELSQLILRRLKDPRVRMTTVASVEVSGDLRHARVHVSVVGDETAREASLEALQHASGYLRRQLAKELFRLKNIPDLRFELDRGAEYSQRISDLLEESDDQQAT